MKSGGDNVVDLGPHANMTPAEALAVAAREEWEDLIVIGYHKGDQELVVRSSAMTRRDAVWLCEFAKLHAMKIIERD